MFTPPFEGPRAEGVLVPLCEGPSFLERTRAGLAGRDPQTLYQLVRTSLIKGETRIGAFRVSARVLRGFLERLDLDEAVAAAAREGLLDVRTRRERENAEPGRQGLARRVESFPKAWISPERGDPWGAAQSTAMIAEPMGGRMYELTPAGLDRAVDARRR